MTDRRTLDGLGAHSTWIYAAGLLAIVGARLAPVPRSVRIAVAGLSIAVMVLTYAGEQVSDRRRIAPWALGTGVAGTAVGAALTLTGSLPGLLVLGGGLLFVRRGLGGTRT